MLARSISFPRWHGPGGGHENTCLCAVAQRSQGHANIVKRWPQRILLPCVRLANTAHNSASAALGNCAWQCEAPNHRICRLTPANPLRCCACALLQYLPPPPDGLFNSRRNHMTNSNSNRGSSGSNSEKQQGSNTGSNGDSSSRSSGNKQGQQDQSSDKQNSPGSTRSGTHEQHDKAGQKNHKNS